VKVHNKELFSVNIFKKLLKFSDSRIINEMVFTHRWIVLSHADEHGEESQLLRVLAVRQDGHQGHRVSVDGRSVHRVQRRQDSRQ